MEFDKTEYKTVEMKFKSEEEKNKFFTTLIVLILFVALVVFFHNKKANAQEADASDDNLKLTNPEVQVELAIVIKKIGKDRLYEDFCSKTYHLQIAFAIGEQEKCFMGLKRTRELYQAGFKPEALFEYATVIHTHLNEKLEPFLRDGVKPKFKSAINIAYHRNLINQEQKDFLHKLRNLRNTKAHEAGVNFDNDITEMFLNSNIILIETTILC